MVNIWLNTPKETRKAVKCFIRSHMCYFQGTKFYVAPDPYRKGSITGFCLFIWVSKTNPITGLVFGFWFLVFGTSNFFLFNEILTGSGKVDHLLTPGKQTPRCPLALFWGVFCGVKTCEDWPRKITPQRTPSCEKSDASNVHFQSHLSSRSPVAKSRSRVDICPSLRCSSLRGSLRVIYFSWSILARFDPAKN